MENLLPSDTQFGTLPKTFYWRELAIDMNSPDHQKEREMILRLMERQINMNPKIFEEEAMAR